MGQCIYCGGVGLVKCLECDGEFCNDTTDGISHAVYHLVRSRHKRISLDNKAVCCSKCNETNIFKLGVVKKWRESRIEIPYVSEVKKNVMKNEINEINKLNKEMKNLKISNIAIKEKKGNNDVEWSDINGIDWKNNNDYDCGVLLSKIKNMNSDNKDDVNNNYENKSIFSGVDKNESGVNCDIKETENFQIEDQEKLKSKEFSSVDFKCNSCDEIESVIANRIFVILSSNKSNIEQIGEEKQEYPVIRNKFTAESYVNTFIPLIVAESVKEKEIKESMRQEDVSLRFEKEYVYFYFRKCNNELRLNIGDEIKFTHKSGMCFSGYICEDLFGEELKVEIDRGKGVYLEEDNNIKAGTKDTNEIISRATNRYNSKEISKNRIIDNSNNKNTGKVTLATSTISLGDATIDSYSSLFKYNKQAGKVYENICNDTSGNFFGNNAFTKLGGFEFYKNNYTIEYVWKTVCYERMIWAVNKLYKERHKNGIFNYILGGRKEKMGKTKVLTPANFCKLNEMQYIAVSAALTRMVTLIQGPPGTGKTVVSAVIVYNAVRQLHKKVLAVAPSNTAVDNLAVKLNKAGLKVLRIMSRRKESGSNEVDFLCLHNLLKDYDETLGNTTSNKQRYELIKEADVICCTCVTAGQKLFNKFTFPFVLIDEAVQSTEPLSLIPCVYGCTNLVLVGDQKQLGPTVLNKTVEKCGLKQSLFERLLKLGVAPYVLNIQYRMHPDLCEFPSEYFYNGQLLTGSTITKCLNLPSNFFYVSNGQEEVSQYGTSFINKNEAAIVEEIIRHLFKNGVVEQQIGVITPYEGQRSYIMSKVFENEPGNLEISSVDGFQGREKDFIIVSLVRSNTYNGIGFVADRRRLNVTLTRAKYGLVIIGNPFTLYKNQMWASLLNWYDKRGNIYEGPIHALRKTSLNSFI